MKQKRVWILAMIIGAVVSSGVSGVVSAVTPDGVAQSDPVVEYLTEQAKAEGVDFKAKIDNNNKIMQLAKVATEFELAEDVGFVDAVWNEDLGQGEFVFCREPSGENREQIASLPFPNEIYVNGGWCADELTEIAYEVTETVGLIAGVEFANVGYDAKTGAFKVTYGGIKEPAELSQTVSSILAGKHEFVVEYAGSDVMGVDEYRGGDPIDGCTAGFVVRNGGTFGVSTAGHCSLPTNLYYSDGYFTSGGHLNKSYGDAEWYWSLSGTPYPSFRQTTGAYMTVTSVISPSVGMGFCQYGKTSLTTCSSVYATNQCFTSGYGTVCGIAVGTTSGTAGGDSGGPVFSTSGGAIGIHKGSYPYAGATRRVFTPVTKLEAGAGLKIYK